MGLPFVQAQETSMEELNPWPEITNTNKTWTRWWWMGSAVDKSNIRKNLVELQKAGIGGVEITPIYGVKGEEENYLDFLSSEYMEMLNYTVRTADSLDMQVDMVLGTGWPYGGPQVEEEYAATKLVVRKYELKRGQRLNEEIISDDPKEKIPAKLQFVLAYGENGEYQDLTEKLNKKNHLKWKAKKSDYTLYAVFAGKTTQQVKRAAPGGNGYTVDHYSEKAFNDYVQPFEKAFSTSPLNIRAIFNDSFEVYGTDFTPDFFSEFERRRAYDLKPHLPLLLSNEDSEESNRLRSDYRETLSDLLLEDFNRPWTDWANGYDFKTRLQAHGSPGNLIDMYASADIPEAETFGSMPFDIPGLRREKEDIRQGDADPVMLKFSSSAAHISGKPLTSAESFTWLRDHFKTALSQTKPEAEELFLNGINHLVLHGTTYSPDRASWPGWKFYASVNFSPNNTIWKDAPALFSYIARSQSMLQAGQPDNDVLVYWPIHDVWHDFHDGQLFFQLKIHSLAEWLYGTSFYEITQKLTNKGYGVDFISDRFLSQATLKEGKIQLPGGSYKSIVVPDTDKMPLETLQKLISLKEKGGNIIFSGYPVSVPGFHQYKEQNEELDRLISANPLQIQGILQVFEKLEESGVYPERLVNTGLKYIRRDIDGEKIYFLVNHTSKAINEFIPLQNDAQEIVIFDPLTGAYGKARAKTENNLTSVRVHIAPGQSLFLKTGTQAHVKPWEYYITAGDSHVIQGHWKVSFEKGGPK